MVLVVLVVLTTFVVVVVLTFAYTQVTFCTQVVFVKLFLKVSADNVLEYPSTVLQIAVLF